MGEEIEGHSDGQCEKEALRNKVKHLEAHNHNLEIKVEQYATEIRKLKQEKNS